MDLNVLKNISISKDKSEHEENANEFTANDIAIIGIDAQIGNVKNVEEFWAAICEGSDMIRDFPAQRWNDANQFSQLLSNKTLAEEPLQYAYLDRIDLFDAGLFNIPPVEAELMDPAQRIFLESAWSALEDSGYGGKALSGSSTGVYVGYGSVSNEYNSVIDEADEHTYGVAVSGNVNSIIASRISYLMNLKGPAIIVDTACSSSLVAVHLACQQIRDGEVSMALVGGIRLVIIPPQPCRNSFGIESSSGRTKTFDDQSDGTGGGEGVISMVLKSLQQAVEDQDNIYAVIKGSSINQDGTSLGITAPNAGAQRDAIQAAWKDANINPESISYIEAHGTATNLGDPVEISGIEKAFNRYTNKKQFCAIGSVKSNMGHLDCAAGLAGLLKVVLMLKHKKIPPTKHFTIPNQKIDFMSSPVYVNDKLVTWEQNEGPRRCGISSFGISGTNCHMILEEAPDIKVKAFVKSDDYNILTISGKSKDVVMKKIFQYQNFLIKNPNCSFDDFCYTANIGRSHYNCRFAMVVDSKSDFVNMAIDLNGNEENNFFYKEYKLVNTNENYIEGQITSLQKNELSKKAEALMAQICEVQQLKKINELLQEMVQLYLQGADVIWNKLYDREKRSRVSIPSYPFQHKRYWIKLPEKNHIKFQDSVKEKLHPLVDECILDTYQMQVYSTKMSSETCWELKEHMINGKNVLPGTAFIEMSRFVSHRILNTNYFEMEDLVYLVPLSCMEGEERTVHTIIDIEEEFLKIACCSKNDVDQEWICHVELKVKKTCEQVQFAINLDEIINRCHKADIDKEFSDLAIVEVEGDHWDNVKQVYTNENEILIHFQVDEKLEEEMESYFLFTSMLDSAINAGNYLMKSEYLPFSYAKARFYEAFPKAFYSHIKKNPQDNDNGEFATFEIILCNENGKVIGEVEKYVIKKVHQPEYYMVNQKMKKNMFYNTSWIEYDKDQVEDAQNKIQSGITLVIHRPEQEDDPILQKIRNKFGHKVVTVKLADKFIKISETDYQIGGQQTDYDNLLQDIGIDKIEYMIQLSSYQSTIFTSAQEARYESNLVMKSTFLLVKALLNKEVRQDIKLCLLTQNAMEVDGSESIISSINRSLIGMGSCIGDEYGNIKVRSIDCDKNTNIDYLINELMSHEDMYSIAYRQGKRYVERINLMPYAEKVQQEKIELTDQGVYIITGGLGGMGLSICKYLLSINPKITVVLLNRTYTAEEFKSINSEEPQLVKKMHIVEKLWNEGKSIDIIKCDVSDYNQMKDILQDIREKRGGIFGIIHTAGVAGDGFILRKEWETFEKVLAPKVYGTWNLHNLTLEDELSFFVMCSSFTSVFGAPGQSDYTAANAYLDSFAYYRKKLGLKSLTINWTGWSESGMAVNNQVNEKGSYVYFLNDAEGAGAFAYALKTNEPRVLIGEIDYSVFAAEADRYRKKLKLSDKILEKNSSAVKSSSNHHDLHNIIITGKSLDELTDIEKQVISIWTKTLGVDEVDLHDKFFESGGNSLLASYLHKELDKIYPGVLVITDVFVYSTITDIAEYISSKSLAGKEKWVIEEAAATSEDEDIEKLIAQFVQGELDIDEIEMLMG